MAAPSAYTIQVSGSSSVTTAAGSSVNLTVTALDSTGATLIGLYQNESLSFYGLLNSPSNNAPTVTDKSGSAQTVTTSPGAPNTTLNFVNGVATINSANNGVLKAYNGTGAAMTLNCSDGTATSQGGTGAAGLSLTVNPAPATRLQFTTAAQSIPVGTISGTMTVQRQDQFGNPNTADASVTVNLSSTSGTGVFRDTGNTTTITSVTINTGSSTASFKYYDATFGTPTLTAADAAAVLTSAAQLENISSLTWSATPATYNWNTSDANWTGAGSVYADGDGVTFNDTGSATSAINLVGTLSPASVTVTTSLKNYTFTGSGYISGSAILSKIGSATLTIATANDYSGTTTILGGVVDVQNSAALGGGATTVSSGAAVQVDGNGLTISEPITLNGSGISSGGALRNLASANTASGAITLASNSRINSDAGSLTLAGNSITGTANLTVGGSGNVTNADSIATSGMLIKDGNGTLSLIGNNNTYSGGTLIGAGVVGISGEGASGGSPGDLGTVPASATATNVILNGGDLLGNGTFALNANRGIGIGASTGSVGTNALIDTAVGQVFTVSGIIALSGNTGANGLAVNSGTGNNGTVVLGGANTFTGSTVISNGYLQVANTLALQNSTLNYSNQGGFLVFDPSITAAALGGLTGTQNLGLTNLASQPVTLSVGTNNASTIYSGGLNDAGLGGSLAKAGSGTLTLTGNNSYGAATVNAGSLVLNGTNILSGATTINSGGNSMLTVSGGLLVGTSLTMNSANSSLGFLLSGGTASFSGNVTFSADNGNNANFLQITNGVFNAGSLNSGRCNLNLGIATQPTAGQSTGQGIYVSGAATVNITNTLGIGGSSANANSSTSMRVDNGTVNVGGTTRITLNNATRWSVLDVNGGTFASTDATGAGIQIGGGYAGASSIMLVRAGTVSADTITFGDGTQTTGTNVLSQTGGTLYVGSGGIVSGNASPAYTNKITLGTGTVGATGNWSSSLPMTLSGTTTFQAADASSNAWNIELDGVLSGTGALNKTGNGTLTLTGADNYAGGTTNNGGTLRVNGSIDSSVTVNSGATNGGSGMISGNVTINSGGHTLPGGSLTTTIGGNLTYNNGAEADFNLSSTYNSGNDQIVVNNGAVTVSGVNIGIYNAGSLDTAGAYVLMTNLTGTIVGSFARTPVWLGTTPANAANYSIVTLSNNVLLQYSPIIFSSASATPNPAIHGQ